jgi:hypothetical protein
VAAGWVTVRTYGGLSDRSLSFGRTRRGTGAFAYRGPGTALLRSPLPSGCGVVRLYPPHPAVHGWSSVFTRGMSGPGSAPLTPEAAVHPKRQCTPDAAVHPKRHGTLEG